MLKYSNSGTANPHQRKHAQELHNVRLTNVVPAHLCNAWVHSMTPRGVSMPMSYHAAGVHARYECIQVLHLVDECSLAYTISRPRKSRRLASLSRASLSQAAADLSLAVGRHAPEH